MRQWKGGDPECSHEREIPAHWNSKRGNGGTTYDFNRDKIWPKGVCGLCGAVDTPAGIGLEPTIGEWVENIVTVGREIHRVLRDDGSFWLNLGDSYSSSNGQGRGTQSVEGGVMYKVQRPAVADLPAKNLIGQPWRAAFALQDDGWILRSAIVWHKCLSGGAWLYAKTQKGVGPHMVKDLVRLDPATVHLWNGAQWTQVVSWTQVEKTQAGIELTLRSGERIGATAEHRWPTQRGLLSTADLVVGDVLETCHLPDEGQTPAWLTPDALWFAGLYLADGSMSGKTIQLDGHAKETSRWERVSRLCAHYGASCQLYVDGNTQAIHIDKSASLRAVLQTTIGGHIAKDKHLTSEVWRWSNDALHWIADGYLEGDGHTDGNRIRLGFTRNYALERDLRTLAARLDTKLTLKLSHTTMGDRRFSTFLGEWRWKNSNHPNTKPRSEVLGIGRSNARKFWDIAVADAPHTFSLASGVCSHNSNPMPEPVTDRPTSAYEMLFLLAKQQRYFYDATAVRDMSGNG